jgi:hypothetical protein
MFSKVVFSGRRALSVGLVLGLLIGSAVALRADTIIPDNLIVNGTLTVSRPPSDDGFNAGYLNLMNSSDGSLWHLTYRVGDANKLQLYYYDGTTFGGPFLNVNTDGNVGIGTNDPKANLGITDRDITTDVSIENTDGPGIRFVLQALGGGTSLGSGLRIFNPDATCDPLAIHGCPAISIDRAQNVGIGTPFPTQKLHVEGNLFVNGSITKTGGGEYVTQSDPNDGSREIVYATPIGGEVGTYLRGSAQLVKGEAVINLPEHFDLVTSEVGLTVQLTAQGEWLQLYVVQKSTKQIVVHEVSGKSGQFDYLIQGIRKGYENHQVIQEK